MRGLICDRLRQIANSREHAYKAAGRLGMRQMKAISRIRNVAGYFSAYEESKQLRAVKQLQDELLLIMPDERSRFRRMKSEIIQLIQKSNESIF